MRILIAEDEVTIARVLKVMLEKNKYAVDMVHNGSDALDYIQAVGYDALVLDCLWFCHCKAVRIPGTEEMAEYRDYRFHLRQSCIGMLLGLPICAAVGALVALLETILP